jgi:hypothetical protein
MGARDWSLAAAPAYSVKFPPAARVPLCSPQSTPKPACRRPWGNWAHRPEWSHPECLLEEEGGAARGTPDSWARRGEREGRKADTEPAHAGKPRRADRAGGTHSAGGTRTPLAARRACAPLLPTPGLEAVVGKVADVAAHRQRVRLGQVVAEGIVAEVDDPVLAPLGCERAKGGQQNGGDIL